VKTLPKNIAAIGGSDLLRKLIGFLTITYLTRHISVSDFGIINIGFTVLSYILIVGAAGLPTLGTREAARSSSTSLIYRIVTVRFATTLATMLLVCVVVFFVVTDQAVAAMIILMSVTAIPNALYLDWYYQGKEAMSIIGIARGLSALTNFILTVFFVKGPGDLYWVALAAILSDSLACGLYYLSLRNHAGSLQFEKINLKVTSLLNEALPLGIGSILAQLSINIAPILIGIVLSIEAVGIFSASYKLVFFLLFFDRLLATILLPATSRLLRENPEKVIERLGEAQKWVFLIALPVCAGGAILSPDILSYLFGKAYLAAAPLFSILIWFVFFTMMNTVFCTGLVAAQREKDYAKVMVMSSALYAGCITLGTLLFGLFGTAVGLLVAETGTVILSGSKLLDVLPLALPREGTKILGSVLIMITGIKLLPHLHVLLLIGSGIVFYSIGILLLKAVSRTELRIMRKRIL